MTAFFFLKEKAIYSGIFERKNVSAVVLKRIKIFLCSLGHMHLIICLPNDDL